MCSLSSQGSVTWVCLQHSESAVPVCWWLQGSGSVPPALPGLLMETMVCSEIFPSCSQLCGCLCCERAPAECSASAHSSGGFLISCGSAACSALGWLMARTKDLTSLEPPQLGQNLSLCAAQTELGKRQG